MSEWQPIANAPMDGLPVLVAHRYGVCAAFLENPGRSDSYWRVSNGDKDDSGLYYVYGDEIEGASIQPTHWMPLPDPPEITHE